MKQIIRSTSRIHLTFDEVQVKAFYQNDLIFVKKELHHWLGQ